MNSPRTIVATAMSIDARISGMPALISVRGLRKYFAAPGRLVKRSRAKIRAVDNVSFNLYQGETLAIVGESGSGKSTLARLMLYLLETDEGEVSYDGVTIDPSARDQLRSLRREVQIVFQDSYASLNPRLPIVSSVAFGPLVTGASKRSARERSLDMLDAVGLKPERFAARYPHELSGGQRQRVNIARALAMRPRAVILDEPVSALDKSVEAQVLNLLADLKARLKLTYLLITHDLDVVRYVSDRVVVMYLGKIVEIGPTEVVCRSPRHPYTEALLSAIPSLDPDVRLMRSPLEGDPPSPIDPPSGCRFRTRCPYVEGVCAAVEPHLHLASSNGSAAACHMAIPGSGHSRARMVSDVAVDRE